jgi:phenylacetate-CoA ligase
MVSYIRQGVSARRGARYFNEIEAAPPEAIARLQERKLQAQLACLRHHSVFYRNRLAQAGVDWDKLRSVRDLEQVPFTVKQDLRNSLRAAPPFGHHLAADPASLVQMQASSGTMGSPSYVGLTEPDLEQWCESSARSLFACGIRPGDLVLHAFSLSKGFLGGLPIFRSIQYMGAVDVPIGADAGPDRLLAACRDTRPRSIVGTPNFLIHLAQTAPDIIGMSARDLGCECLVVGGEPGGGTPALRQQLEEEWGAKSCEMMGGTDLGVIYWAECHEQRGMHMVAPDHILAELIDPETGSVIAMRPGAAGELVYTALERQASPVLRFRSGDHVEILDDRCACGRTGPVMRCFGRTDDMLIVRGVNLFPSAVQDVIGRLRPRTSGVVRVLADFAGHSTQQNLTILVERGEHAGPDCDGALRQDIERRVRDALVVKVEPLIVPAGFFETPGAKKVLLTLREMPAGVRRDAAYAGQGEA